MVNSAVKAQKYLMLAHFGAAMLAGLVAAFTFNAPDFIKGFFVGCLLVLVTALFRSKMRDEYIERLWNAGTAAAFFTALAMTVGGDLVVGYANPKAEVFTISAFTTAQIGLGVLIAFYLTFHLALWRNRA